MNVKQQLIHLIRLDECTHREQQMQKNSPPLLNYQGAGRRWSSVATVTAGGRLGASPSATPVAGAPLGSRILGAVHTVGHG